MSRIIKSVPTTYKDRVYEGIECDKCGRGYTNRTTEQPCDQVFRNHNIVDGEYVPDSNDPGRKCDGTQRHVRREWRDRIPGHKIIKCDCGAELYATIGQFTITCDRCHADYNGSGARLAPRSQWGEETNESVDDILRIDAMTTDELLDGD